MYLDLSIGQLYSLRVEFTRQRSSHPVTGERNISRDPEQGVRMTMCTKDGLEVEGSNIHSQVNTDTHMPSLH